MSLARPSSTEGETTARRSAPDLRPEVVAGILRNERSRARLLLSATMLYCTLLYWSFDGLRYDDSYIFLRIAQNMIGGHGPVWNIDDHFTNTTSALWPALIALGGIFVGHSGLPLLSKTLSYFCLFGSSISLYLIIARSASRHLAWVAPFCVFLPAHHFVLAGMESDLALFALLLTILLYSANASLIYVAAALAALYLARPDGVLFAALLFTDYLFFGFSHRRRKPSLSSRLSASIGPGLVYVGLCLPWHAYLFYYTGSLLPTTLHAKIIQGTSGTYWDPFGADIRLNLRAAIHGSSLFLGAALLGLFILVRIAPLIPAWVALHLAAYAAAGIAAYTWYYYPLFFAVCTAAYLGIGQLIAWAFALVNRLTPYSPGRIAATLALLPAILLGLAYATATQTGLPPSGLLHWAHHLQLHFANDRGVNPFASYDDSRSEAHDQISDWIIRNRPASRGSTLLTDEIGVIGYRLSDWRVVDEVGMTDPDFSANMIHNWPYYVQRTHPQFINRNYLHSQPDIMSFRFDAQHYGVYRKVFEPNTFFISVLYERQFVYGSELGFLKDSTLVCHASFPVNPDTPKPAARSIYRLNTEPDMYAIVTTIPAPKPGFPGPQPSTTPAPANATQSLNPTSIWQSAKCKTEVTITTMPPGRASSLCP